ncbi:stage V sporulation protein AE [Fervidicella metallireducens AeB]|uniref:Stage V sporulation protein AE n=1 Tax=Fervidicella metallireducens AeB TaxID=1403537 RepID=A0A017RU42_9CLOT|nr:stage V sporulation protein AE [Fervidicella metallireducens]EYE88096.1 stage V sporulation protein AE [Fervidicella metallireducens AeB]
MKRKVILVTDGDRAAQRAVEIAAKNIGGRCISRSAGNPTPLTGAEIVEYIKQAKYDPVVVMVDDRGDTNKGSGEEAMEYILKSPDVDVLGVIAVASNTNGVMGIKIDCSIDQNGNLVNRAVDKHGIVKEDKIIKGDTVDILNDIKKPFIVGVGDPGKMDGFDDCEIGAPIITKAMDEILKRSNFKK